MPTSSAIFRLLLIVLLSWLVSACSITNYKGSLIPEYPEQVDQFTAWGRIFPDDLTRSWRVAAVQQTDWRLFEDKLTSHYWLLVYSDKTPSNCQDSDCLTYRVADSIAIPSIPKEQLPENVEYDTVIYDVCRFKEGPYDNKLFAVVGYIKGAGIMPALKAWRVDLQQNKFIEIDPTNINCWN